MDLDELRAFLAIVEHGSLLEAARALAVSRTTLRRRAEALEARAGVPLYTTTAAGVHATDAGRALAEHGRRLVQESAAVMSAIKEVGQDARGVLRVVVPVGMPPHAGVPLYAALRARHPQLTIHARIAEDPLAGRLDDVDLALHFGPRAARGPWITRRLAAMRTWLVAAKVYVARRGAPTTLDALHEHTLMTWRGAEQDGLRLPLRAGGHLPVAPAYVTSDIHMLRQSAIAGLGIALVPDGMLPDPGFAEPPLVPVLPDLVGEDIGLWAAVPEALRQAPKIRALIESLESIR